jgi:hypothetical protein
MELLINAASENNLMPLANGEKDEQP